MERNRDVLQQLLDIYYLEEKWHKNIMPIQEAIKYHSKLLGSKNILYYQENDTVLGYCEYWRVTPDQLKRIVDGEHFSAYSENVNNGEIAYLANLWIKKDMEYSHVVKMLKLMFFAHTRNCKYYAGNETKRNGRLRIFVNKGSD